MSNYVSIQIAGYRGWILQQYNVAPFRDRLEALLVSNFSSQTLREIDVLSKTDDREVYCLKVRMEDQTPGTSERTRYLLPQEIYIKRYYTINWKQKIQTLLHVHKAQKSWRIGKDLVRRGIPTPLPIAYLIRKANPPLRGAGGCSVEHILITQGIENGVRLSDYVRHYVQMNPEFVHKRLSLSEKRELIQCVAEFLAKLHTEGIYHGDFTTRNILVEDMRQTPPYPQGKIPTPTPSQEGTTPPYPQGKIPTPTPSQEGITPPCHPSRDYTPLPPSRGESSFRVYLIDLDSVRSTHWILDRRRIKNLDELGRNFLDLQVFSTTDRGRFLKHYLRANPKETRTFKQLFRCVFQRTQKRLRKYGKHFSPPPNLPHQGGGTYEDLPHRGGGGLLSSRFHALHGNASLAALRHWTRSVHDNVPTQSMGTSNQGRGAYGDLPHRRGGTYRNWILHVFPEWKELFPDINTVCNVLLNPEQIVQENNRGVVLLSRHNGTLFVAKRSKIQENRCWAQFTSLYRQGEGTRTLRNMKQLCSLGLPVPEPVLVLEKKAWGFVVASWSLYRYLEGRQCDRTQAHLIAKILKEIHQKGWVHRDPHVKNFLLNREKIYIIDCAKARPWRSRYAQMYDVVLLNNCCPGSLKYYGISESYWVYRLAKFHNNMIKLWRRIKRQIRPNTYQKRKHK